ncbi:MAG TPA: DUF4129 domain-containing protein [Gemmataceae bacterium]|jgi:hypothetical protein|nr:DUF4129 domain-containing protein [Gemmataceae bacterium]
MIAVRHLVAALAVALLASATPLHAQPLLEPDRKLQIPGEPTVPDYRKWFTGQLKQPPKLGPNDLKELLEQLKKMPKDKQPSKEELEKLFKNPAFKDPEFLKQFDKMLHDPDFPKNLEGKLPKDTPVPDKDQGAELANKLKEAIESDRDNVGKQIFPKDGPPKDLPDPSKLPAGDTDPYADNEWVKWAEKNFGDSPAAKDAIKDLVKSMEKGDLKGIFDDVPEFKNGGWKDITEWGKSNGADFGKIKPPDISTGNSMPHISGGGGSNYTGGGGGGSAGGIGAGGIGLSGGGGTALMVIAGIAAAIFVCLMLFRRWKAEQARREALGIGTANGIDLDAIRTREQLVEAFDQVSLDQIGEEARPWNHRVIADEFAELRPTQAAPATELAGLYERARYAPLDEDLSAGEFADARRDLHAITGGAA